MAARENDDEDTYSVPPELVPNVCQVLEIDEDRLECVSAELLKIGSAFAGDRGIQRFWGNLGEQREAIRKLIRSVEETLIALHLVSPEYLVAFEPMLEKRDRPFGSDDLIQRTRTSLLELHEGASRFDKAYRPKRGAAVDLILEEAVRNLITFFRGSGFEDPAVTPGRDGREPKLRNKEAVATATLIRGIDPKVEVRSIVNMIIAVKKGRACSEPHLNAIWEANENWRLDCFYRLHRRHRI